jgi:hypothetical protein
MAHIENFTRSQIAAEWGIVQLVAQGIIPKTGFSRKEWGEIFPRADGKKGRAVWYFGSMDDTEVKLTVACAIDASIESASLWHPAVAQVWGPSGPPVEYRYFRLPVPQWVALEVLEVYAAQKMGVAPAIERTPDILEGSGA